MATITTTYTIDAGAVLGVAALNAKISLLAGQLDAAGELDMPHLLLGSVSLFNTGNTVECSVELLTDAESDVLFPTDASKKDVARNFYTQFFASRLPAVSVVAAEPVVT